MLNRKYFVGRNLEDEIVSGVIYYEGKPNEYLEENWHIEEVNETEGRWMLTIERYIGVSDDFDKFEKHLLTWLRGEGVDDIPADGFGPLVETMFSRSLKNIDQAKRWVENLVDAGKDFHFDDDPHGVIDYGTRARVFTDDEAASVCKRLDEMAGFDWGEYECPIGYVLHLQQVEQLAECERNGHRDTGRGVCAHCDTFLE
jgi:hypothetical protein